MLALKGRFKGEVDESCSWGRRLLVILTVRNSWRFFNSNLHIGIQYVYDDRQRRHLFWTIIIIEVS
jgi:hypothetical protein